MSDNVTPFRRPPQRQPDRRQSSIKDPHVQASLVHVMAIACFAVFFFTFGGFFDYVALALGFVGLIVAAGKRNDPPSWAATHHEFGLRTILIAGALWMVAAGVDAIPFIGGVFAFPAKIALLVWVGLRSGFGLLRARVREPMPRPRSLFL